MRFSNLFKDYTNTVPGDGNCFVHSAKRLYQNKLTESIDVIRNQLYQQAVEMLGQRYVDGDKDYQDLLSSGVFIDSMNGGLALSRLIGEPMYIISNGYTFCYNALADDNHKCELLNASDRDKLILSGAKIILFDHSHYQPLSSDITQRQMFAKQLNELDHANTQAKENIEIKSVFDELKNTLFDEKIAAVIQGTALEILDGLSKDTKGPGEKLSDREMAKILIEGIKAESEFKKKIEQARSESSLDSNSRISSRISNAQINTER